MPSDQRAVVPCEGGPGPGWLLVEEPLPFEVERGLEGVFVLDDLGPEPKYVYVTHRLR
jgi:hypothetical protein